MRGDRDLEPPGRASQVLSRLGRHVGRSSGALALGAVLAFVWGCRPSPAATGEPGEAVPGLSPSEQGRFAAGMALFNFVFRPENGLGPAFNENQCSACHTSPATGGFGGERVLRATIWDSAGRCDLLSDQGGANVRRKVTEPARAAGIAVESPPPGSTLGRFTAPPLFGIGFVEAVPEAVLATLEDPDDRDRDGISGRMGRTADGRPARFGRKADVATLAAFVVGAAHQEMGLTSADHPEDRVQGQRPQSGDDARDPELDSTTVRLLTDFIAVLAPPGRSAPPAGWTAADVERGERSFEEAGCVRCHVPRLTTGPAPIPALAHKRVALYSDLLLHDLGGRLADVCGPAASPSELRTEPLLGLRFRDLLMHDGRTTDPRAAILLHGGEAERSRTAFVALGPRGQAELLAFLKTL